MITLRLLIATDGVFKDGRSLTATEIVAMENNFNLEGQLIPVTYDYYEWSPTLSEVVSVSTEVVDHKMRLYVEVKATKELQEIAERKVDHYLVPCIFMESKDQSSAKLINVSITQNPLIPGLDKLQFEKEGDNAKHFLRGC